MRVDGVASISWRPNTLKLLATREQGVNTAVLHNATANACYALTSPTQTWKIKQKKTGLNMADVEVF